MVLNNSVTEYVFGDRKNGVDNVNVVFAVAANFIWARDQPSPDYTGIAYYRGATCISTPCNAHNQLNLVVPWQTTLTNCFITQHPLDYYINVIPDDSGHIWLTRDFGQTWLNLNLPANSNLLALTGHTTVDTFNTGAVLFVNYQIGGNNPLIVATPNGCYVTYNPFTAATTMFTFHSIGSYFPHAIPTYFSFVPPTTLPTHAVSDVLMMSTMGGGLFIAEFHRNAALGLFGGVHHER